MFCSCHALSDEKTGRSAPQNPQRQQKEKSRLPDRLKIGVQSTFLFCADVGTAVCTPEGSLSAGPGS